MMVQPFMPKKDNEPDPRSIAHMGMLFAATVMLFTALGYYVDKHWSLKPLGTIAGVFIGFGLGLYRMILMVRNYQERK